MNVPLGDGRTPQARRIDIDGHLPRLEPVRTADVLRFCNAPSRTMKIGRDENIGPV
jgi:hypothetical protein